MARCFDKLRLRLVAEGKRKGESARQFIRILGLLIPCAYLGAELYGISGVFWGTVAADVTAATIALIWGHRVFARLRAPETGYTTSSEPRESQAIL